jgi:phosphoribosylformylglycinamidine synthase
MKPALPVSAEALSFVQTFNLANSNMLLGFVTSPWCGTNTRWQGFGLHKRACRASSAHCVQRRTAKRAHWRCVDAAPVSERPDQESSQPISQIIRFYRYLGLDPLAMSAAKVAYRQAATCMGLLPEPIPSFSVEREDCFYVLWDTKAGDITETELGALRWLLSETFEPERFREGVPFLNQRVLEFGPRLNFQTAWSSNAVSICQACGLRNVRRIERSRRYFLEPEVPSNALAGEAHQILSSTHFQDALFERLHDRMTEQLYKEPLRSLDTHMKPADVYRIPLLQEGEGALRRASEELGLSFDDWDIHYYAQMFRELGRDPTNVELYDIAQSNSEHSRHWLFRGIVVIDGHEMPYSLMDLVREPLRRHPGNSVLAFCDNASTIRGLGPVPVLIPSRPDAPSPYLLHDMDYDALMTAETHNFPSGVAPFAGAETGAGGRIRDTAATGRGSLVIAGTAGYSVGNLQIPGYPLPWEDGSFAYPENLESPLNICIQASNGASDYGNKFGEPLIQGFCRSFGLRVLPQNQRREYVKPIMFSGGVGMMDHQHAHKQAPECGMLVVKVGGPAYRIGLGGGAASSMLQGENQSHLDFDAVQRGDAEMEQRTYRVLRACVELGPNNPIVSLHDQGAGGNCNVVKELIYPLGARIDVRRVILGDQSLSVLEIWVAEYQEQFGLLLRPSSLPCFEKLCERENVPLAVLGEIDGSGRITLYDSLRDEVVVDLDLERVLGKLPRKVFRDSRASRTRPTPLALPFLNASTLRTESPAELLRILDRMLRLVSVGSKRFLTTKVDRSVTGLIARQQTVGPVQLPLADVAVVAQSHFSTYGTAIAIGEQCVKALISPAAMARMAVAEMLTNMAGARISAFTDIKCEGNWMAAGKLPGELVDMYEAAEALSDTLTTLGIGIDGGKDSVSMAARCPGERDPVRAPLTLVLSGYAPVPDVMQVLTPDLKRPGESVIILIDPSRGARRLGGSALAQVYGQVGDSCPDLDDPVLLRQAFEAVQMLQDRQQVLAYHDRSDGGLLVALLEMAFAGNCGLDLLVDAQDVGELFAEEVGMLVEIAASDAPSVLEWLRSLDSRRPLPCRLVARTRRDTQLHFRAGAAAAAAVALERQPLLDLEVRFAAHLSADMRDLRALWEETSFQLDALQANPICVEAERQACYDRRGLTYVVPYTTEPTNLQNYPRTQLSPPRVMILREEGSNGDREMAAAFQLAGFEVHDATMRDILARRVTLDAFQGIAFVGGFSFADVLGSAKGWAGVIRLRSEVAAQFERFRHRPDTFSLGVCNGCQLMALLGWVPGRFVRNESERFESRFSLVRINPDHPSIMLRGMENAVLGVWVSHGEGRAIFPAGDRPSVIPMQYADDLGRAVSVTDKNRGYPFCPNGSVEAVAAVVSADGRHLAMMPHPERTIHLWNWAHLPEDYRRKWKVSPWLRLFQNARQWCEELAS